MDGPVLATLLICTGLGFALITLALCSVFDELADLRRRIDKFDPPLEPGDAGQYHLITEDPDDLSHWKS